MDVTDQTFKVLKTAHYHHEDAYPYNRNDDPLRDVSTPSLPSPLTPLQEWWINFADTQLFVASGASLYAQDEIQVSEHPSLAHLKEALYAREWSDTTSCIYTHVSILTAALVSHQVSARYTPKTREQNSATPILIRGVERRIAVSVEVNAAQGRPQGLYGNAFGCASEDAVRAAVRRIEPPTTTHLVCMAALHGGFGRYTEAQLRDLFGTAYTG